MEENTKNTAKRRFIYGGFILVLAICVGGIHYAYVRTLFENDKHFLYLSDLEREMSLRTEMGFYYSFYKTVVETRPFQVGIFKLLMDRLVEYPHEVNAVNRFNIHPEVMLGTLYRYYERSLNNTDHIECYTVVRDAGHDAVRTCIGIGVPIFFYLEAVWLLAGVSVAAIFMHACVLSDSILGGLMAVLQYFANHSESTRVQWAPNERENFAMPFILLQCWLQSVQLRRKKTALLLLQVPILFLNTASLIFWQFTPYIFMSQVAIFFVMEQMCIIDRKTLSVFVHNHICSLQAAALLFQCNASPMSSLHACYFGVIAVYSLVGKYARVDVRNRYDFITECLLVFPRIFSTTFVAFYLWGSLKRGKPDKDTHVWDILYSKFTDHKSFHTLIYTCSDVFDFMPLSTIINMSKTLLVPIVLIISVNVVDFWIKDAYVRSESEMRSANQYLHNGIDNNRRNAANNRQVNVAKDKKDILMVYVRNLKIDPAVFYNLAMMAVFGLMAGLVMRLKLLLTTQMCILSSLVVKKYFRVLPKFMSKYVKPYWVYAIMIIPILSQLTVNVTKDLSHEGEFNEYQQEELLKWISQGPRVSVYAGSMPMSATVMLATRNPVVTHPHYEDTNARLRAYTVYKMYGKFTPQHYYEEMNRLKATHLIVETKYCYGKSGRGCTFEYIWDIDTPALKSNPKLCHVLLTEPVEHFYQVFRNEQYAVFRIHDYGVQYTPRTFAI